MANPTHFLPSFLFGFKNPFPVSLFTFDSARVWRPRGSDRSPNNDDDRFLHLHLLFRARLQQQAIRLSHNGDGGTSIVDGHKNHNRIDRENEKDPVRVTI
ncbi:hypothetical protein CKAN_00289300 [Cinnamomum micranthum f. kanehirae]|uniref:Uncharacterized protein n=1 Tax=Cinnamomum micranthum f. kanehirae TaxID=337451 RepID=A0A3S3M7A8_9MAGN|nr:hypothetical protein CKAN_00289300 [Cinnamomum micranthum f. kanehirae]